MKLVKLIEYLRNHLKGLVRICLALLAALVLLDAIPAIVNKTNANSSLERFPGFWALFGFAGCVVIILVSKWFGHAGIMTREDYYDE